MAEPHHAYPDHIPVMRDEMLEALHVQKGSVIIDATFGAGGYSRALLENGAIVHGLDRDPDARQFADKLAQEYPDQFHFHNICFSDMAQTATDLGFAPVDGVVFDFGVSSMQLDQAERGFSFQKDGPLDMRMGQDGMTAADFVNEASEEDIANVIFRYGDERKSRRIARAIVDARPLSRTLELSQIVSKAIGKHPAAKIDPATRVFQAIRIHINDELGEIERGLEAATDILKPGGMLVAISFHSLEDRLVKRYIRAKSGYQQGRSRYLPVTANEKQEKPLFRSPKKAVKVSEEEARRNIRARSAILRYAQVIGNGDNIGNGGRK